MDRRLRPYLRKRSSIRFVIFFYANPSASSRHRVNRLAIRQAHDIRFNRPLTDSELERKIAQRFFLPPAQRQNLGSSAFARRHRFPLLLSFYTCILNFKVEVFLPLIKFSLTKNPRQRSKTPSRIVRGSIYVISLVFSRFNLRRRKSSKL